MTVTTKVEEIQLVRMQINVMKERYEECTDRDTKREVQERFERVRG